jgi:hypothetical protein
MADAGVNIFTIMQIAGHKDTATAKRYNNPTEEQLMAAMKKLEVHQFSQHHQNNSEKSESMTSENKVISFS